MTSPFDVIGGVQSMRQMRHLSRAALYQGRHFDEDHQGNEMKSVADRAS